MENCVTAVWCFLRAWISKQMMSSKPTSNHLMKLLVSVWSPIQLHWHKGKEWTFSTFTFIVTVRLLAWKEVWLASGNYVHTFALTCTKSFIFVSSLVNIFRSTGMYSFFYLIDSYFVLSLWCDTWCHVITHYDYQRHQNLLGCSPRLHHWKQIRFTLPLKQPPKPPWRW